MNPAIIIDSLHMHHDHFKVTLCTEEGHIDVQVRLDDPLVAPAWGMLETALHQACLEKFEKIIYPRMKIDMAAVEEPEPVRPCRICLVVRSDNVQVGPSTYCTDHLPSAAHG